MTDQPTDDISRGRRRRRPARAGAHRPPPVRLGTLVDGGLAPAILALVERGMHHRPALAETIEAEIELALHESAIPVRILFGATSVLVEDGHAPRPDLRISGSLSDLTSLMVAPLVGGIPHPMKQRGRAAIGMVAVGRIRVSGRLGLMRRFLRLIRV